MRTLALASLTLLLSTTLPAASAETGYGTSSTGNLDTWGLSQYYPPVPEDCAVTVDPKQAISLSDLFMACGLVEACPAYIGWQTVRLTLLDPSPGDMVALSVADPFSPGPMTWDGFYVASDSVDPFFWVTDIATYDDPVAEVTTQVGGCDSDNTAVVTGLVVEGEVSYEILY